LSGVLGTEEIDRAYFVGSRTKRGRRGRLRGSAGLEHFTAADNAGNRFPADERGLRDRASMAWYGHSRPVPLSGTEYERNNVDRKVVRNFAPSIRAHLAKSG
jgi:hypothetical protein